MSDCVIWEGRTDPNGYGRYGQSGYAHRRAYEEANGPIPEGLHIDHLCFEKACINPEHLEAVTNVENHRRRMARIVACPAGHPYDGANTRVNVRGARQCRACDRERQRQRRAA